MAEHARYGGVVPEIAARAHLEALQPAIRAALDESGVALADLDAVADAVAPAATIAPSYAAFAATGLGEA